MRLFSFISWTAIISPFLLLFAKWIGWISWAWLATLLVAIAIPVIPLIAFGILAIWVIKNTPPEEWGQ